MTDASHALMSDHPIHDELPLHEAPTGAAVALAREFLTQRASLEASLRVELERGRAYVAEIEATLRQIEGLAAPAMPRTPRPAPVEQIDTRTASLPQLLSMLLTNGPMKIGMLVRGVIKIRPKTSPAVIYPAIYRMARSGRLRANGTGKDSTYALPNQDA